MVNQDQQQLRSTKTMHIKTNTLVIGAGVGGLGAGCWLKHFGIDFTILDGSLEVPKNLHNGVHYLHSIPELPFKVDLKKILLTDGILEHGNIHQKPTLMHSLKYSEKVREIMHPSSIMDVGKEEEAYIPSNNSANQLIDDMAEYIGTTHFVFGRWLKSIDHVEKLATFTEQNGDLTTVSYEHLITTVPLDKMLPHILNESNKSLVEIELKASPVYITNFKVNDIVPNWLINIYVPERYSPVYRASILNNIFSIESMRPLTDRGDIKNALDMFFMFRLVDEEPQRATWTTGKVISISIDDRIRVVEEFMKYDVYPIGRFGLWNRKLLIDNTIKQAKEVVHYLINKNTTPYISKDVLLEVLSK